MASMQLRKKQHYYAGASCQAVGRCRHQSKKGFNIVRLGRHRWNYYIHTQTHTQTLPLFISRRNVSVLKCLNMYLMFDISNI